MVGGCPAVENLNKINGLGGAKSKKTSIYQMVLEARPQNTQINRNGFGGQT